ncbi:MAG: hypothetical protein PVG42_16785 [Lysobacterales bacterium]|jgi:hypothetical protein
MQNWIRKNLVLIAGIVLPVLMVAAFLVLQSAPKLLAEPPKYDFLLVGYRYDPQLPRDYRLSFEVRDGHLQARASPVTEPNTYPNRQNAKLLRYHAAGNSFSEIAWDLPEGLDGLTEPVTFPVEAVRDLRLDNRNRSPDGYVFEYAAYRGRGGLLGELFGMGRRYRNNYVLNRNGAYFELPDPGTYAYAYGYELQFLGWVVADEEQP